VEALENAEGTEFWQRVSGAWGGRGRKKEEKKVPIEGMCARFEWRPEEVPLVPKKT